MAKTKIGINGFGRIGRQVFRSIKKRHPDTIEVVAINDKSETEIAIGNTCLSLIKDVFLKAEINLPVHYFQIAPLKTVSEIIICPLFRNYYKGAI